MLSGSARIGSPVNVRGVTINPIVFPSGVELYLKNSDTQINFHGIYLPDLDVGGRRYRVDIENNAINLLANGYVTGSGSVNISPTYGDRSTSWWANTTYYGKETITVPAGEFETVHAELDYFADTNIDGQIFTVNYSVEFWFAEDVGIVRIEEFGVRSELVSLDRNENTGSNNNSGSGGSSGGGSTGLFMFVFLLMCNLYRRSYKNTGLLKIFLGYRKYKPLFCLSGQVSYPQSPHFFTAQVIIFAFEST